MLGLASADLRGFTAGYGGIEGSGGRTTAVFRIVRICGSVNTGLTDPDWRCYLLKASLTDAGSSPSHFL